MTDKRPVYLDENLRIIFLVTIVAIMGVSSITPALPLMLASRSRHPSGVHTAMCDGSVRFISDNIELDTWRALSTIKGSELIKPF